MSVETDIICITPDKAREYLGRNTKNRHLNPYKVEAYSGAMRRGEWKLNGDAIRFSESGVLLDGQHRLQAVINSEIDVRTLVVTGLHEEAQETMDRGRTRTLSDMLRLRGEVNTALLGSVTAGAFTYSKLGTLYTGAFQPAATVQQLLEFLEKHPDLRDCLGVPNYKRIVGLITPTMACCMNYLFKLTDEEDAYEFWNLLSTGDGLASGNAVFPLRDRLINEQMKPQGKISPTVRAALTIKAFNYWREGRVIKTLRWGGGGKTAEPFPRVVECPMIPESDQLEL
jgi:hypothetical protein